MAEQLICNQQVDGSTPFASSIYGGFPERPKGADCKSVVTDFGGPNPPSPTNKKASTQVGAFLLVRDGFFWSPFCPKDKRWFALFPKGVVSLLAKAEEKAQPCGENPPLMLLELAKTGSIHASGCFFVGERWVLLVALLSKGQKVVRSFSERRCQLASKSRGKSSTLW